MQVNLPKMTLTAVKFKRAKLDADGLVEEPPKVVVQLEAPLADVDLDTLGRMYELDGKATIETWQTAMQFTAEG